MFKRTVEELVSPRLVSVAPDEMLGRAVILMAEENVSCILALAGDKPRGILTEQDVVRAVLAKTAPSETVESVMSAPVRGIMKGLTLEDACAMMTEDAIRHLVMMDAGASPEGLLSASNVVEALAVDFMCENTPCSQVMSGSVITAPPNHPLGEALAVMVEKKNNCLVVVESGRPTGVVTERILTRRAFGRPELLQGPLSALMRSPAVVVPADGMVYKIILYMKQKGVRLVTVVDGAGKTVGVMSLYDMVRHYRKFSRVA